MNIVFVGLVLVSDRQFAIRFCEPFHERLQVVDVSERSVEVENLLIDLGSELWGQLVEKRAGHCGILNLSCDRYVSSEGLDNFFRVD